MAEADTTLEEALAGTETDIDGALKAANSLVKTLKRLLKASRQGNLRDLQTEINQAVQAVGQVEAKVAEAKSGWNFDGEAYLGTPEFYQELRQAAAANDLKLFLQDDRIFSYPVLIRVLPGERALMIDKKRERNLRPAVLTRHLKTLQTKPPRFRPEAFLEALAEAYSAVCALQGTKISQLSSTPIVKLKDIYGQLTLLPGQAKEYSLPDFVWDIYLLDESGVSTTKKGQRIAFHASTGTKHSRQALRTIGRNGEEKTYYGIAFS